MHLSISINEEELVKQCVAGEEKGYTMLYNKYAKRIYHTVYRVMGNSAETEDIVQEAFCTAFEQIGKLKNQNNFEGWLKRIALNQAISTLRKKKMVFTEDGQLEAVAEEELDMNEELLFQCKVDEVKAAIQQLPDGYRTIMSLHLFEDMGQEEIGNMLGISHSTVRTQYHRAKKKVYLALKDKAYYGT
ncbi:RNA polymerase sigma factor [Pedobacter chitinilyticus]|uniref:Sigma-70 family RNA polymerase sigma factor n=1 Tax=Pedobacter chitinilyticus TaxID=2233776 RepID=A0A443YNY4_9SPHI|nr:sigma-70 family RNA polymerase sigma factor [Pedobacter chitinilyticus]RWU05435.1 sigma-70 family RNA polymerase sigma factor [Pedobacter chitinilyticus]